MAPGQRTTTGERFRRPRVVADTIGPTLSDISRGVNPMTATPTHDLASTLDMLAARHPTVGLAAAVVGPGGPRFACRGLADIATARPITPETVFRIASITKTFTAIAVMQLRERGLLDLDDPARAHLRSLRFATRGFGEPTIRHLLTHTAGLGELAHPWGAVQPDFGESVPAGRPLPTLAALYRGAVALHAEPGTRFVYTNHAPAILGQLVEDVARTPLAAHLAEHVFAPLGMVDTTLVRTPHVRATLATGHEIGTRGVRVVADRDMVTAGAASAYSTPSDLTRYATALLDGGRGPNGRILTPESLAVMFAPQYRPDPRVPGIGLAFFRHPVGGIDVVGHQGTHPGFHSQLLLAPGRGVGAVLLTNGAAEADFWLPTAAGGLVADALGVDRTAPRRDLPLRPEVWPRLAGRYALPARLTDTRLRGMIGAGAQVFVAGGRLRLRFLTPIPQLYRGFDLHPDDPDDPLVFRADLGLEGMEPMRFVFAGNGTGPATALLLDAMPLVLPRRGRPGRSTP